MIIFFSENFHLDANELTEEEEISFLETMKRVWRLFKNKDLKIYLLILLIKNSGMVFFTNVLHLILVDKGLPKTTISMLSTLIIPFQLFFLYQFGKMKENLMKNGLKAQFVLCFICVFELLFLYFFDVFNSNFYFMIAILFLNNIISSYFCLMNSICHQGFFNKIVDRSLGATYLTLLNSTSNLSVKWPTMIIYSAIDIFGSTYVGVASVIITFIIYFAIKDKLIEFDDKKLEEWKSKKE